MDIKLTAFLCKYESQITQFLQRQTSFLQDKTGCNKISITHNIPNINPYFYQIKQMPYYHLQFKKDYYKSNGSFYCESLTSKNNLINERHVKVPGYSYTCTEYEMIKESWYIFAVLTRNDLENPVSTVYFCTEKNNNLRFEGVSLNSFIKDLNTTIDNYQKRYYTEQNIKDILIRFQQ